MQIEEAGTPNKFIVMRQEVLLDKRLSVTEKIVYARICTFDTYFESAEACANVLGLTKRQVEEAKRKLEKLGYIQCVCNTGRGKQFKAKYDLQKNVSQTYKKSYIRPTEKCKSDLQKIVDIDKRLEESIEERENVDTAKAAPTLPPEAYKLSELLYKKILDNKPNRKIGPKWHETWSADIDKIHRLDNREWARIEEVIEWSQQDDFWWKNILSGETLRNQFDRLESDMEGAIKSINLNEITL